MKYLREILYSFNDVLDKYIMEKKFCSIYEIALSNGIINFILLGIFSLLDYYYFHIYDYKEFFNNFKLNELFVIFAVMITNLGLYISRLITNKNNSPCHLFIIFVFGQISFYIDFSGLSIIVIIFLIFVLFLSLIFIEIIELNFCGLSENTKKKYNFKSNERI